MSALAMWLSWALLGAGTVFCVLGAIGVVRFPDVYTRMHAASLTDTLGGGLILLGLGLQAGSEVLVIAKLFWVFVFLAITSPTSSHAVVKAAMRGGVKPKLDP
ncbi:monovalent cation/H(+) antiporter subunit G [Ferrimonas balearica]|uniref:monovalent cation/H(+) antiporter subunit G n=1 Tax=Ferrimonas balearica TaxID=44012 RepID=UPI001C99A121|nr:monovalent cation/H(+) antiporter subunit G [Ferrimonas balearica]MBY5991204.1 monovalent cation/H(+) antiporter subunit G [Ferrimonas balearica]